MPGLRRTARCIAGFLRDYRSGRRKAKREGAKETKFYSSSSSYSARRVAIRVRRSQIPTTATATTTTTKTPQRGIAFSLPAPALFASPVSEVFSSPVSAATLPLANRSLALRERHFSKQLASCIERARIVLPVTGNLQLARREMIPSHKQTCNNNLIVRLCLRLAEVEARFTRKNKRLVCVVSPSVEPDPIKGQSRLAISVRAGDNRGTRCDDLLHFRDAHLEAIGA